MIVFKSVIFENLQALVNFRSYRENRFFTDPLNSPWVFSDVVHIITADDFQGKTIGASQIGSLCQAAAVGINLVRKSASYILYIHCILYALFV